MGRGGCFTEESSPKGKVYTWDEIKKHATPEDKWIVIENNVYDVTRWQRKHPGGARIISHFAGQDATEAWYAMHSNKEYVHKFMKPLYVGQVDVPAIKKNEIMQDFAEVRKTVEDMGLFKTNPWFFAAHMAHILALEVIGYLVLRQFGVGWGPWLACSAILTVAQAQAGWTQHDYGHLSVFKSNRVNHWMHYFVIGGLKAASSHWWNFRHFQHHAKPNVLKKDPDVDIALLFLLGEKLPVKWGKQKRGYMPYQFQHNYFWTFGPPTLLPLYFHIENIYFVLKRRDWTDLAWMMIFFARFFACYGPMLGGLGAFALYMFVRFLESFWFTFVTQMSHIPMEIDEEREQDWVTSQLVSTCNVDPSFFNDWFSGHLNFQIEHHLFPTMPRHNYIHAKPLVESLCKKHKLPYISKPLGTAMWDIIKSLKKSGSLWYDAYYDL